MYGPSTANSLGDSLGNSATAASGGTLIYGALRALMPTWPTWPR